MTRFLEILAPAKINLFLQVTGRRPDGYHELVTLMCCVSLYDKIALTFGKRDITVTCAHPEVPQDQTNLAQVAARLFFENHTRHSSNRDQGVEIAITKRIPVAAGLGGGSSDAAAVLLGLNRHYGNPFSKHALRAMGQKIGADVPFFIDRKPAIATGIGEKLKPYNRLKPLKVLLVYPGFGVSTAGVYEKLNLGLTKCEKTLKDVHFETAGLDIAEYVCNDLETVTLAAHPDLSAIKESLLSLGAQSALMSGSGPTIFGLFSEKTRAQKASDSLIRNDRWQVFLADLLV